MSREKEAGSGVADVDLAELERICARVRAYIVRATTAAGSGHPTSSFSATEVMVALFFHRLRYRLDDPKYASNDRVIFSKGHAAPLLYALYAAAGEITVEELDTLRRPGSRLQGHPMPGFVHTEAATGSLGQGLSIGVGMALAGRLDRLPYQTWVLLGDGELAEGSVWEAAALAGHDRLGNLAAIADINRLGQSGPTMLQRDLDRYRARFESFGWRTQVADGHDLEAICAWLDSVSESAERPAILIAGTVKGKGVSFLEDKEGWHGKALSKEEAERAYLELGRPDAAPPVALHAPPKTSPTRPSPAAAPPMRAYEPGEKVAPRKAYGLALARLAPAHPDVVALDGDTKNSTFAEDFAHACPERYFEMFIAEQNMAGAAAGLAARGKRPFASTFAAFWTRAADQIRMATYSGARVTFVGSHAGVSIGEDGPSQMGLEDLALFRALADSTVLYPCDAVSTEHLVEQLIERPGISYLRTTRAALPVLYGRERTFAIGGSHVLRESKRDRVCIVAAGITVHEALSAAEILAKRHIAVRVLDAYSIRPLDVEGLRAAAGASGGRLLTVEDHWPSGGLGEAVASAFADEDGVRVRSLAVRGVPGSGPPEAQLAAAGIDAAAIVRAVEAWG